MAKGQDLCYITITDNYGILEPNAANRLDFKIEETGTIAAVANADMKATDMLDAHIKPGTAELWL